MRVLFLNMNAAVGVYGVERWMLNMGAELVRAGHWAAMGGRRQSGFLCQARAMGFPTLPLRIVAGFEVVAAIRLAAWMRRHGVQAVCAKNYKEVRVAALARAGRRCSLWVRRGALGDLRPSRINLLTVRHLIDGVLVPSEAVRQDMLRAGGGYLREQQVVVLRHGIRVERYADGPEAQGLPSSRCRVVYVGRLAPIKGTDVLLEAWRIVLQRCGEGPRLLLVGDASRVDYKAMASDLGVRRHVDFAGFQDDVRPWLRASDLVALPSRSEGSGYVILEGAAAGLPLVASRVGGIPEYCREGETALLTEPGNSLALAEALAALIHDPFRRRAMGLAAQRLVASEYSLAESAARFLQTLEAARFKENMAFGRQPPSASHAAS